MEQNDQKSQKSENKKKVTEQVRRCRQRQKEEALEEVRNGEGAEHMLSALTNRTKESQL